MPPPDTLDFLLGHVSHLHYIRARQLLESLGLYRGQPMVLRELWEQEGRTQTELADLLNVTAATITKTLQRMEKQGFLQRRPDPTDQRVSRVYLTAAGRAVQQEVEGVFKTMETETFRGLAPEDLAALRVFLTRIRDNLLQATVLASADMGHPSGKSALNPHSRRQK
jgi:MarR family transcriptional regulator, organic hydroperoxide resistance regulator